MNKAIKEEQEIKKKSVIIMEAMDTLKIAPYDEVKSNLEAISRKTSRALGTVSSKHSNIEHTKRV